MRPLLPPLNQIEQALFFPSDSLLQTAVESPAELPPGLRSALEADALVGERLELLRQSPSAAARERTPENTADDSRAARSMPGFLRDQIGRRVAARQRAFSPPPRAGQVLRIDTPIGPAGPLQWDLPRPLAVLLDEPGAVAQVWRGWLTAAETDYAGLWDVLLEPEDEPFDPLAGMVQVWNPVSVYLPSTGRVLAELGAERLAAVRAVAAEFATGPEPDPGMARPGFIAPRSTLHDRSVLTGTPLYGPQDPRRHYQELYYAVANAVREPARLALAAAATAPQGASTEQGLLQRVVDAWRRAAAAAGTVLQPVPEVAHAMAADKEAETGGKARFFQVGEDIEVGLAGAEDTLQLTIRALGEARCQLLLHRRGLPDETYELAPGQAPVGLTLDPGWATELRISCGTGAPLLVPLPRPVD